MATTRRAISKKTRFAIFKRDDFTCRYCGRQSPEVRLEIDHIKPVVDGGTDEPHNLKTACFDCNRGKGARGATRHDDEPQFMAVDRKIESNGLKQWARPMLPSDLQTLADGIGATMFAEPGSRVRVTVIAKGVRAREFLAPGEPLDAPFVEAWV